MAEGIHIDFRQMPWSKSPASWQHHDEDTWQSVRAAASGSEGRVVVLCPASSNSYLSGVLAVDAKGFTAQVEVCATGSSDLTWKERLGEAKEGGLAALLHGLDVHFDISSDEAVTLELQATHPDKTEARPQSLLNTLWDLQLAAVTVLQDVFGVSQTPPDKAREQSIIRSLAHESD